MPSVRPHDWGRTKLRMLSVPQHDSFKKECRKIDPELDIVLHFYSGTREFLLHRLVLLTWIGELELAKKLLEENQGYFWGLDLEEIFFRILICEQDLVGGYKHPEFYGFVQYILLREEDAFKLSTTPLSELLKMDKPHFSSVDGLIEVDFEKRELERIAKMVPEKYHGKLRLPLIFLKKQHGHVQSYKAFGTKLELLLLQKLLKLTEAQWKNYAEVEAKREYTSISMFGRRKFQTIYKILPETSSTWLSTTDEHPDL